MQVLIYVFLKKKLFFLNKLNKDTKNIWYSKFCTNTLLKRTLLIYLKKENKALARQKG
tara:strand:- start:107 stop:280 length:174 start_codon:yes stop_codon:yes gene_type:complete